MHRHAVLLRSSDISADRGKGRGVEDRGKGRRPMRCRTLAYALPIFLLNGAFAEHEPTGFLFSWHETSDHGPRLDEQENSGRGEGSPGGEGSPAREARGEEAGKPRGTCKVSAKHSNNAPRPSELSNLRKAAPKEAGGTGVRGRILHAAFPIFFASHRCSSGGSAPQ